MSEHHSKKSLENFRGVFGNSVCVFSFWEEKLHKHKLFGPDFPRTFLTLTPGCPGVKKFLPITGAAEKRAFGADIHDFRRGCLSPEGFSKNFVQKMFVLIFGSCFCPLPKRGRFDENGEKDTFYILPTEKKGFAPRNPENDENDENGGCHSGKGMV